MLERLGHVCFALLAAAVAIYVAVHLIESVAAALIVIVAAIGGLLIVGFVFNVLWHRHDSGRW